MIAVPMKIKADDTQYYRSCFDYRKLNDQAITDIFPTSNLETILNSIESVRYYSILGMKSGFSQLLLISKDTRQVFPQKIINMSFWWSKYISTNDE